MSLINIKNKGIKDKKQLNSTNPVVSLDSQLFSKILTLKNPKIKITIIERANVIFVLKLYFTENIFFYISPCDEKLIWNYLFIVDLFWIFTKYKFCNVTEPDCRWSVPCVIVIITLCRFITIIRKYLSIFKWFIRKSNKTISSEISC